ncbi:hypothetical protein EYB53_004430 [Candidatus Chloroploca sp. M-50]|uniref:SH3b domain-containing protein n=1 Tax=Candidatus Chloroploca mongolica TaxID=2528176 RepID=A0ABS4D698_9CHLR|nr:hypothetical protein [Candidatus Chloroploca mongolica]MBP1464950.1 hypothetical protein [Candidatus Chloroploca mongolica]
MLLVWGVVIWLFYPYALSVAAIESNVRVIGLVILVGVLFAAYKILRNLGLVIWHLGLLWLAVILLASFVGSTVARGRTIGATTWPEWNSAGRQVLHQTLQRGQVTLEQLQAVPTDIYLATTGNAPFWRPAGEGSAETSILDRPAEGPQFVLASEQDASGITKGVIVMAVSDEGSSIDVHYAPSVAAEIIDSIESGTLLYVTDGPVQAEERIWWEVSDLETEGWCTTEALRLNSR